MGLNYQSLTQNVRQHMAAELATDIQRNGLYKSPRIEVGKETLWQQLLQQALSSHDDDWLVNQIRSQNLLKTEEQRTRKGKTFVAKVPITAPETLAEGEFNHFYIRGVCLDAIANNELEVEIYRGKDVMIPRPDSEQKIGTRISAANLLNDLRVSKGVDTGLGLPPGPNSGLTVKRVT